MLFDLFVRSNCLVFLTTFFIFQCKLLLKIINLINIKPHILLILLCMQLLFIFLFLFDFLSYCVSVEVLLK